MLQTATPRTPSSYCLVPTCLVVQNFYALMTAVAVVLVTQLPQVVYVDDPRMFQLLTQMFPGAQLVQDAFHLLDRFSRAIPASNTLKGEQRFGGGGLLHVDTLPHINGGLRQVARPSD